MKRVLVTGATGRTGRLVLQKLRDEPDKFEAIGLARFLPAYLNRQVREFKDELV